MQRITPEPGLSPPRPLHGRQASQMLEQQICAQGPEGAAMARAAQAVVALLRAWQPHARHVWFACGPGNNGGDGLWAAALLRQLPAPQRPRVSVCWHGDEARLSADARHAKRLAEAHGVAFLPQAPTDFDVGVDALLGLSARPGLSEPMAAWLACLQNTPAPTLCIDLPSGLDPDTGHWPHPVPAQPVGPRCTLSLLTLKPGLFTGQGRDASGEIWHDDLGLDTTHVAPQAWLGGLAPRRPTPRGQRHGAHKGTHGDVWVIGGQDQAHGVLGMTGAALLAAQTAARVGAGRVYVGLLGTDRHSLGVDIHAPELMFRPAVPPLSIGHLGQGVVVCGCGGGEAVAACLPEVLQHSQRLVLDADGLNHLARNGHLRQALSERHDRGQATILTPHPLEAARLLGCDTGSVQRQRLECAQTLAQEYRCSVVLKGSGTVVACPECPPVINPTGNALLATAGTGDVLAGYLGGQWAQVGPSALFWLTAQQIAVETVYQHGQLAQGWPKHARPSASQLLARL